MHYFSSLNFTIFFIFIPKSFHIFDFVTLKFITRAELYVTYNIAVSLYKMIRNPRTKRQFFKDYSLSITKTYYA